MKRKTFIIIFSMFFSMYEISSQEFNALDLYKSCKNYKDWIDSSFDEPVNSQILFNMGKCQGIMETTGKMMATLCKERKRNANINKQLSANLEGIRTISLVREFVLRASYLNSLQNYNSLELLSSILSNRWPCN